MTRTISPAARRLRELRKAKGLSLRKMAIATGITYGYLWQLEVGEVSLGAVQYWRVKKIAASLDVDVEVLMEGAESV